MSFVMWYKVFHYGVLNVYNHTRLQHYSTRKCLDQVNILRCLGSLFTSDGGCEQDVRRRIDIVKSMEKVTKQ